MESVSSNVYAKALEALKHCHNLLMRCEINRADGDEIADTALRIIGNAMRELEMLQKTVQPEMQPLKERPDFIAGYNAGMDDAKRMARVDLQQPEKVHPAKCSHLVWTEECEANGWRSSCSRCGKESAGSGQ